jgi:ribosomal protein L11 methylase PrmA
MGWLAVTLTVNAECIEKLSDALFATGALSVDVTDAHAGTQRERALFYESGETGPFAWKIAKVNALFAESMDVAANVVTALGAANLDPAQNFEVSRIEDQNCVRHRYAPDDTTMLGMARRQFTRWRNCARLRLRFGHSCDCSAQTWRIKRARC